MHYAILRHAKLKSHGAIAAAFQHNARLKSEPNVDASRSDLNVLLDGSGKTIQGEHGWLNGQVRKRLRDCGIERVKEDTVLAVEVMMATSPDWWDAQGPEGSDSRKKAGAKWFNENLRYLRERFGEENVLSVALHLDEKTPHMHAIVTPIVMKVDRRSKSKEPKPTLCAKDMLGGRGRFGLSEIVQTYGKRLEHLGLQPGQAATQREKPAKHVPIREHQKIMTGQREALERLRDSVATEKERQIKLGRIANEVITLVSKGDLELGENGGLTGSEAGLQSLHKIQDEIGQEETFELAKSIIDRLDRGVIDLRETLTAEIADAKAGKLEAVTPTDDEIAQAKQAKLARVEPSLAQIEAVKKAKIERLRAEVQLTPTEIEQAKREMLAKIEPTPTEIEQAKMGKIAAILAKIEPTAEQIKTKINELLAKVQPDPGQIEAVKKDQLDKMRSEVRLTPAEVAAIKAKQAADLQPRLDEIEARERQMDQDRVIQQAKMTMIDAYADGRVLGVTFKDGRRQLDVSPNDKAERSKLLDEAKLVGDWLTDFLLRQAELMRARFEKREKELAAREAKLSEVERAAAVWMDRLKAGLALLTMTQRATPEASKALNEAAAAEKAQKDLEQALAVLAGKNSYIGR